MTDDKTEKAITEGKRAELLMNDPVMVKAFDGVRADFLSQWLNSKSTEDREKCWMAIHTIEHVKTKLVTMMTDGKVAQSDLDRQQ